MADPGQVVAVTPDSAWHSRQRLFTVLAAAFGVRFAALADVPAPAGVIHVGDRPPMPGPESSGPAVPAIVFAAGNRAPGPGEDVQLCEADPVDRRLRGITLPALTAPAPAASASGRQVLAVSRSGPRWTAAPGPVVRHHVAAELPELGADGLLHMLLWSEHSLAVVALTHFLRGLCHPGGVSPPPLRAALVFDDPNVRWRDYGFINYRRLVRHADAHDYHAVMAMVPRDAMIAHGPTAALFAQRADRVSLAVHGNDHLKDELMIADGRRGLALGAQALRRIAGFERRTGLRVDRVMNPPHGACSASTAWALGVLGFDALCALHPQPWTAQPPRDQPLAGWDPATFAGPLAVMPRFPLFASRTEIALRAFLSHPLVLYGHHTDLAAGLDLLADAAMRVNSVGEVKWGSLGEIAQTNAAQRLDGETLVVRPYAGRVRVRPPAAARRVVVEPPRPPVSDLHGWTAGPGTAQRFGESAPCPGGAQLEIRLRPTVTIAADAVPAPRWMPWAPVRRTVAESRDRLMPLRHSLAHRA